MSNLKNEKKDFFISYTSSDEDWATWVAETLEKDNYTTIIQAWDFQVGGSFINDMHDSIKKSEKIILILSPEYLQSAYCTSEWQNFFTSDPIGKEAKIIPIRIKNVKPDGLLSSRTYIDLYNIKETKKAEEKLLNSINPNTRKRISNGFPGK